MCNIILDHFYTQKFSDPFFFFNDTTTTEIYTLSLHDALPILFKTMADVRPPYVPEQAPVVQARSEEHTSELQSRENLVCSLLLEKKKKYDMDLFRSLKKNAEETQMDRSRLN